ncbi:MULTISPECIES: hypothetical protein [Streptococcus]|uniref:Uncharacterized protein n=1 Tax=Streptococcus thermophilus TaxID=1308 RepID=A0A8D6UAX6_STRTR|nr:MULTISPECIES: hypothetical protein [Streptococcus]MCO4493782.1 hypothetical protein [Streptococcus infantarius subsp. infantarius]ASX19324.1 hypothetical protein BGL51_04885 [Streptococcus thermophilus]MBW7822461.1 hypothetical protein [Streptococcus thermophilus]MCE2068635.1 hypothetical protein [Streptococcus thermophilus]MCE2071914.1 hypothetical protein [Streptococcus thermophilus]
MTNHIRVLTAVVLSQLIIEWPGYLIGLSIPKIIGIVLLSTAVEAILHICCVMKYHSDISLATSLTNFKQFIWKTIYYPIIVVAVIVVGVFQKKNILTIFFEWNALVVFYTVGFIMASNNVPMKKRHT